MALLDTIGAQPSEIDTMLVTGIVIGAIGTSWVLSRIQRSSPVLVGPRAASREQAEECHVVLVGGPIFGSRTFAQALDVTSGYLGFSHCYIDAFERDAKGVPLVIDCLPAQGVHRRPASTYDGRDQVRIVLPGALGAELYGAARSLLGATYDVAGGGGYVCSEFVTSCLPEALAKHIRTHKLYQAPGGYITPNQIAVAFGIQGPEDDDVLVELEPTAAALDPAEVPLALPEGS